MILWNLIFIHSIIQKFFCLHFQESVWSAVVAVQMCINLDATNMNADDNDEMRNVCSQS